MNNQNLCTKCTSTLKLVELKERTQHFCPTCKKWVKRNEKKQCRNCRGAVKTYLMGARAQWMCSECRTFGPSPNTKEKKEPSSPPKVLRTMKWDRNMQQAVKQGNMKKILEKLTTTALYPHQKTEEEETILAELRNYLIPETMIETMKNATQGDKWVEKTTTRNLVSWALTMLINNHSKGAFTIKGLAENSVTTIGQMLGEGVVVGHNAIGERIKKEEVIQALEIGLQLSSTLLGAEKELTTKTFVPVYYDHTYLVKKGGTWELCKKVEKETKGVKIGVAREWESEALVGITCFFDKHPGEKEALEEYLLIDWRPGIIHVTDKGPFALPFLAQIQEAKQFFIMPRKKDLTVEVEGTLFLGREQLQVSPRTKVWILREDLVTLTTKTTTLPRCKLITLQLQGEKGTFKTIQLITNLPHTRQEIVKIGAKRWRATETEFNIWKNIYGFKHLAIRNAEKVWPLLLLLLIATQLLTLALRGLHHLHGGEHRPLTARAELARFLYAFTRGHPEPWTMLKKCSSPLCPYGRKQGERLT